MPFLGTVQDINALDDDRILQQIKNISGAGLSPGAACELDVVTDFDGVSVTACKSGSKAGLFRGIVARDCDNGTYGVAVIHGLASALITLATSAALSAGDFLVPAGGVLNRATMSAATTSGFNMISLLQDVATSAGYSSGQTITKTVFVRAV